MWEHRRCQSQSQPDTGVAERHREFCNAVREYAEHMLKFCPSHAEAKWIVRCYRSVDEFTRRFPSAVEQAEVAERLRTEMTEAGRRIEMAWDKYSQMTPWQLEEEMRYAFGSEEDDVRWLDEEDLPQDPEDEWE